MTLHEPYVGGGNLAVITLADSQQHVALFLHDPQGSNSLPVVDYSSPEAFVLSMIAPLMPTDRHRTCSIKRLAVDGQPRTLKEMGRECGLTRNGFARLRRRLC